MKDAINFILDRKPKFKSTPSEVDFETIFKKVGLKASFLEPKIRERLEILNESTPIFRDESRAVELATNFFDYYNKKNLDKAFNPTEKRAVLIGTLLSDIGKTGPNNAPEKLSACITDIFSIDNHIGPEATLEDFLKEFFAEKKERYSGLLNASGINTAMPAKEFFRLHVDWTYDILKNNSEGIPIDAITAAASHHVLEGKNPAGVIKLTRVAKMVIILDQYDARRRRGNVSNEEAVRWFKEKKIDNLESREEKEEFLDLLGNLEEAFKDDKTYDTEPKTDNGEYVG